MSTDPSTPTSTGRPQPVRALVLLSGGLDSQLAVCVLREQDVAVCALSFESPFFTADAARTAAAQLGIPILVENFTAEILSLLQHPKHGFGAGMNPCLDCHTAMIRRAGRRVESDGYHFVATGEVLNQRPMSQNRRGLDIVAQESGYATRLLRPLSARCLPESEMEQMGWVDRSRLLGLSGRSRREQMALAERYGLKNYPTPAGGCRLTEPNFSVRLRDLRSHGGLADLCAIRLLRVGRHFRLADSVKLIVGRNEADNNALEEAAGPADLLLKVVDIPGPLGLLPAGLGEAHILMSAAICARYSDADRAQPVTVSLLGPDGARTVTVAPLPAPEVEQLRIA